MEYYNYCLGKGLSEIRKLKGFSAKEVYSGLCHRSVYRKIENGEVKNPSFPLVMSFCSRLGITADILLNYSIPSSLERYTNWLSFADKSFRNLQLELITSNLPVFSKDELVYLKNELPTVEYQKLIILYFMAYFVSDNNTYETEEIILYLEEAFYLTYRNETTLITATEISLVNNLLNLTGLSNKYFKIAVKFKELLLLEGHDVNERSRVLINNAIAFYYYYKKEWDLLFEHATQFIENYGDTSNYVLLHPFKYFIGISIYKLGRQEDGIKRIRETILSIKITEQKDEYANFQRMIIADELNLSWFDNIDYHRILLDYIKSTNQILRTYHLTLLL